MVTPEFMEALEESDDELLLLEPRSSYDACIVGVGERFNARFIVYDRECVLEVIRGDVEDGDDSDDDPALVAEEYFSFNVVGAWMGDSTPAFLSKDL